MLSPGLQLILGFGLAAIVGLLAWRLGALDRSGALGAFLIGGAVFGFGGPVWGAVLVAFFFGSSVLSYFRSDSKSDFTIDSARTPRRNLAQTLANGGLAAVLAVVVGIVTRESPWYPTLTLAYFGALSAAAADTWATELGLLSTRPPRLITTGAVVLAGRSGGVTTTGLLASLAGGAFIGLSAFVLIQLASLATIGQWFLQDWFLLPLCTIAGFSGSLLDSFLGATWQRQNYCNTCQITTEQSEHSCGTPTEHVHGASWLNNEVVNFIATATGAVMAAALSLLFI
jgi:uncharacterized protein (TIGR00297 family)